jgi:4-amino-4-deoxy-L-arabinose transferase-like glycosyltransferase
VASLVAIGCLAWGAFALNASSVTGGQGGVPLDDAWIHFQFARNLARGDGFAFNPGQPTAGSTAPLWTLLLAGAYAIGGRFPVAAQLLSAAGLLLTLIATYALGKRLTDRGWTAWLAGALVAVNGRVVWASLSALETCLFAALSLLAINRHLSDRSADRIGLRTAALFGLAALARPEGYLLFALALADFLVVHLLRNGTPAPGLGLTLSRLLPAVALFATLVIPYTLFALLTAGHPLPNTFGAKATFDFRPDLDFLSLAARYLILDNPLLLPFVVLGTGMLLRRARLLSAWIVGLPLVYAFLHAALYQHGRYLIPLVPCNAVVGVAGLVEAGKVAHRRGWRWPGSHKGLAVLICLLVLAGTAWRLPTMARLYAWNVDNINQMHVAIGRWVAQKTPPDAILALNDIGAIAYLSERQVVDLAGLITPDVIPILRGPDTTSNLAQFLAQRRVDYVIIFPNWFPGLAERGDMLEEVHQVTLNRRTITGGKTMLVYRALW